MKMDELGISKRKRGIIRSSVTRIINNLEVEIGKDEGDPDKMEELLEHLQDKFETLKLIDRDIEKLIGEEEIEKEIEGTEEYRDRIVTWLFRTRKRLSVLKCSASDGVEKRENYESEEHKLNKRKMQTANVKLPKILISTFNGEVRSQWLSFWNSFETAIHTNEFLSDVDKFNYLKAHLGGSALATIEGFAISSENYKKSVDLLRNKYGKKGVLINTHMNNLLNIPPLKRSNDIRNFRKLFDNCQMQIRSLESLGVQPDTFGSLLCPMILKLLSHDLVLEFNKEFESMEYTINDVLQFMEKQLNARERTSTCVADVSFRDTYRNVETHCVKRNKFDKQDKQAKLEEPKFLTASDLFSSDVKEAIKTCVFCDQNHQSFSCKHAFDLKPEDRLALLKKKGVCFRCLRGKHLSRDCKVKVTCSNCGKRHAEVMCFAKSRRGVVLDDKSNKEESIIKENATLSNCSNPQEVYLQTLATYVYGNGKSYLVRLIIDTGSQRSYVSKFVANELKLKCLGEETILHGLFGGIEHTEKHKRYNIQLSSIDRRYHCNVEVLDQTKICASMPTIKDFQSIKELRNAGIFASDIEMDTNSYLFNNDGSEIHLLLGADVAGKLFTGDIKHLSGDLVAMNTHLGWTVMGKAKGRVDSSMMVISLHVDNCKISDLWSLDSLGITDPGENRSKIELDKLALEHFAETVTRDESGRYHVCIPWLEGHSPLLDHKSLAEKRLKTTVKTLRSNNNLQSYQEVFDDWEKEGIIERITPLTDPTDNNHPMHFLPHRAVIKEHSTTRIRPVFDGSAKTRVSVSLNECVVKGPNLIELIPSILNRFRWGKIGVVADIRKAFLQICVHKKDRQFLCFLWWKDGDPHQKIIYRHCRVVFGMSCSPFLLAAVLNYHFDQVEEPLKKLAEKLRGSMYVDNCVTSVDSREELFYLRETSRKILSSAQFDLRGWVDSDEKDRENHEQYYGMAQENSEVPVLGLVWDASQDTLSCDVKCILKENEPVTKRRILSVAHSIFDPIGVTCPVTLIPKLLLQECWKINASWDSKLPEDIVKQFDQWRSQLFELKTLKIPRRLSVLDLNNAELSLHIFCDASKYAYATGIFLRAESGNVVTCQLIQARSKVAPLKKFSIPRMELLACNIGARLASSVVKDLNLSHIEFFYWTDSMDALYWIKRDGPWAIFVTNRVKEIRDLSSTDRWNYVPGTMNTADLPSRGCSVKALLKGKWWEGPLWLYDPRGTWPNFKLDPNVEVINTERKKTIVSSLNEEKCEYYHHISSYTKIIRVTGWIYRFYNNIRRPEARNSGELSAEEVKEAERVILRRVQQEAFLEGVNNRLKSLPTIKDVDGLIKIKTKVFMRTDRKTFRLPIVLPTDHNVVKYLIIEKHKKLGHVGVQALMAALREEYWILKSRRAIKRVIRTCVICQRFSVKPSSIPEGTLPEDRVREASVFEIVGVDVAGPLLLRDHQKTWILIITCAVYRAVHLELLTSLSTENFLLALRRFIARRGRPQIVYSDNGKNFTGFNNLLGNIDLEKLKPQINPIVWKFIPPSAPWWGGFWERLVGVMKNILRKVLGKAYLCYEEMATVLCDCESLLNSRPLTYVSDDAEDLSPITPAMFLHEIRSNCVADLDHIDQVNGKEINKRLKYRIRILNDIRTRFRSEYLGQLRHHYEKGKKHKEPKVGDLFLLWSDHLKRANWVLGRIVTLYPSKDGFVRLAKIRTKNGILFRPIQKLCPLELDEDDLPQENKSIPDEESKLTAVEDILQDSLPSLTSPRQPTTLPLTTRAGRVVKIPIRYRQ